MTSKYWALVGGAVACLMAAHASAAPWLEPGDVRARSAVQKLADRGHLDRSVTTWPLMWGNVANGVEVSGVSSDAASVGGSWAYLSFELKEQTSTGFHREIGLQGSTDPVFMRGFNDSPRANGELNLNLQWLGESWAIGLNPAGAANPEDDQVLRLDGSYLAGTMGNWVVGAGAIDRWWGPGWQSSLILSNNARPVPAVWLNRKDPHAPVTSWLEWVGPWQFTVFAGQLERKRAIPDTKLIGMRFTFRPVDGLDIGLSRALQWGGKGRPQDLESIGNALIGRDNGQSGPGNDPSNQLGSIDIRYGFPIGSQSASVYAQMMGEDEAGAFPARKSWLTGADWTSQFGAHEQQWFIEYANTLADDFFGSAMPNISYEHHNYKSGYRYYGRNMAASIDGDSKAVTLGGYNFFADGSNLGASLTWADLNTDGGNRTVITDSGVLYSVPEGRQEVTTATISYGIPFVAGWLELSGQFTDSKIKLLGNDEKNRWSLGASWRYRF